MKTKRTIKRVCAGEYKVYINGEFAGNITNQATQNLNEWSAFDQNNEWIGTLDTKKECVECFSLDTFNNGIKIN